MDLQKISLIEHLIKNQGYLKWGLTRIRNNFAKSLSLSDVDNAIQQAKEHIENAENTNTSETKDIEGEVPTDAKSAYIQHLEDLGITEEDVDSVKYWQTSHGQHRFSVVRKYEKEPKEEAKDVAILFSEAMKEYAHMDELNVPAPPSLGGNQKLGLVNLYDAHLDLLSLSESTFEEVDQTFEETVRRFIEAFNILVRKAHEQKVNQIIFPIGNDLFESNDFTMRTKRGTHVRTNTPWEKSYKVALQMLRKCITTLSSLFEKVTVPVIYGNHCEDKEYYLGVSIAEIFRDVDHVQVDYDKIYRKYYKFGDNMLGLSHGYKTNTKSKIEKLPLNMAAEAPKMWGDTTRRYMYLGHVHHAETHKILSKIDAIGTEVNFLRTMSGQSEYEVINGFTGVPKAAYLEVFEIDGSIKNTTEVIF